MHLLPLAVSRLLHVRCTSAQLTRLAPSSKSRCNGKNPCAACIARGREDDCCFTISRRGGKPKPKADRRESDTLRASCSALLTRSQSARSRATWNSCSAWQT
jgi:hypothetical protein